MERFSGIVRTARKMVLVLAMNPKAPLVTRLFLCIPQHYTVAERGSLFLIQSMNRVVYLRLCVGQLSTQRPQPVHCSVFTGLWLIAEETTSTDILHASLHALQLVQWVRSVSIFCPTPLPIIPSNNPTGQ